MFACDIVNNLPLCRRAPRRRISLVMMLFEWLASGLLSGRTCLIDYNIEKCEKQVYKEGLWKLKSVFRSTSYLMNIRTSFSAADV